MFFLLRAIAVIAVIFHFSPVHDAGVSEAGALDAAASIAGPLDMAALEEQVLSALDDPRYEDWAAVPRHARDRLTIEIARQLADRALAGRLDLP